MATESVAVPISSGSLSLLEELSFGTPVTTVAPSTPQPANLPVTLPPAYPARLVTTSVLFAAKPSRSREPSAQEPVPLLGSDDNGIDSKDGTAPIQRQPSAQGAKRRTLASFSSLPPIPVVGLDGKQAAGSKLKSALKGTTSAFIKGYEGLPLSGSAVRGLGPALGGEVEWGFWTCGKSVFWADLHPSKAKEPIAKLTFQALPTALALAEYATMDRVELLLGFASGDIMLLDPICARYTRFNKAGCITASPVTCIQRVPPSEGQTSLFATGHADGCVLVWDKERDDGSFVAPSPPSRRFRSRLASPTASLAAEEAYAEAAEDIVVTSPPQPVPERKGKVAPAVNPISHWWISRKALTDLAFSPDGEHCAVTSEDGVLRIIEVIAERLLDAYGSYFGAITCVSWSADGRFCATGGQDDLVCVYAPSEQRIVARCQGHTSFIAGVSFETQRSDERCTRFASVGDDRRVIFWDLSNASLHRPKVAQQPYLRRVSAASSLSLTRRRTLDSVIHLPMTSEDGGPVWHSPPSRQEVSMLQPSSSHILASDLLTRIVYLRDSFAALTRSGKVLLYARPGQADRAIPKSRF